MTYSAINSYGQRVTFDVPAPATDQSICGAAVDAMNDAGFELDYIRVSR